MFSDISFKYTLYKPQYLYYKLRMGGSESDTSEGKKKFKILEWENPKAMEWEKPKAMEWDKPEIKVMEWDKPKAMEWKKPEIKILEWDWD